MSKQIHSKANGDQLKCGLGSLHFLLKHLKNFLNTCPVKTLDHVDHFFKLNFWK